MINILRNMIIKSIYEDDLFNQVIYENKADKARPKTVTIRTNQEMGSY